MVFYAHHLGSLADNLLRHKLVATHLIRQEVVVLAPIPLQVRNGRAIVLEAKFAFVTLSVVASHTVHRRSDGLSLSQVHIGRLVFTVFIAIWRHAVGLARMLLQNCIVVVLYAARLFCSSINNSSDN